RSSFVTVDGEQPIERKEQFNDI
ncbi:hypothetical protein EVA_21045, partial [gut metagenome]